MALSAKPKISIITARAIFFLNLKICLSYVLWQLITYINEQKKREGSSMVDLA